MKNLIIKISAFTFIFIGLSSYCATESTNKAAVAQPSDADVLLDIFRKKGLLTEQDVKDAQSVLKERRLTREQLQNDGFKFKVNKGVKSIELFGDAALRFEIKEGQSINSDTVSRQRFRYRLRIGAVSELTDDFYAGLRLETSTGARSAWHTFGDDAGPWGKDNDRINVGRIYLGWKPTDWFRYEIGKIENPIKSSILVWDTDLNPEGMAEMFTYSTEKYDLFANFGQFLYDDGDPENAFGSGKIGTDAFMLAWQVGGKLKLDKTTYFMVAPAVYNYTGRGDSYNTPFDPASGNISGVNNLLVVDVPAEFGFTALNLPWKIFGQVAVNADGSSRASAARAVNPIAYSGTGSENLAYQAGIMVGKSGKKGTWDAKVFWLHRQLFSLDPNLVDSDYFDSMLNLEGIGLNINYSITDNIFASFNYAYADRINDRLPTGRGDLGDFGKTYTTTDIQMFQLQLNWKF